MKKTWLSILILLTPLVLEAQTITLGPIAKTAYCVGDTMIVSYQATGTFAADNFFYAQVSDPSGSFTTFSSYGHTTTLSGTIAAQLNTIGSHFRIRITSSDPYSSSIDNGTDILVLSSPSYPELYPSRAYPNVDWGSAGFKDDSIGFHNLASESSDSKFLWMFDQDATPNVSTELAPKVMYATDGAKTGTLVVTNRAGCSSTATFNTRVLSCEPSIPSKVHVVTGSETGSYPTVWVKTGGGYTTSGGQKDQVVFVEPGASVTVVGGDVGLYYIKKGGSFVANNGSGYATVVLDSGESVSYTDGFAVEISHCNNLQFDYSQVSGSVKNDSKLLFAITQNSDHLKITAEAQPISTRIISLLGTDLLSQRGAGTLDIDLSPLPAGMYFAVIEAGGRREVRKIAVVH